MTQSPSVMWFCFPMKDDQQSESILSLSVEWEDNFSYGCQAKVSLLTSCWLCTYPHW